MTQYDKEFEKWWNQNKGCFNDDVARSIAYSAWQAAKAPQPEVKPLELEGGRWAVTAKGAVLNSPSEKLWRESGRERKTREEAEAAAKKMRKRDVLHAHATQFMGGEYEYKVTANAQYRNCFIGYHHDTKKFYVDSSGMREIIGCIYMTRECAEYLCAALNEGRLVL